MKPLDNMTPPKILLMIVVIALCTTIFQNIHTRAQTTDKYGATEKRIEPTPVAFVELAAQLKQASSKISALGRRLDVLETRESVLQKEYRDMTGEISRLRDLAQSAVALKAGDHNRRLKIEKAERFTGGRPGPKDMVVSISQFSITWNQIDTILDKLDEIVRKLSLMN
jgi:septal ring factor EnvC (AmiA/AmiB activator)